MQASIKQRIMVPTKVYDGGSSDEVRRETTLKRSSSTVEKKHFDAFSYYSNHSCRIDVLLGDSCQRFSRSSMEIEEMINREHTTPSSGIESQEPTAQDNSTAVRRQTRISFELHPSLLIADIDNMTRHN